MIEPLTEKTGQDIIAALVRLHDQMDALRASIDRLTETMAPKATPSAPPAPEAAETWMDKLTGWVRTEEAHALAAGQALIISVISNAIGQKISQGHSKYLGRIMREAGYVRCVIDDRTVYMRPGNGAK